MLYQLSYLGTAGANGPERAVYSKVGRRCPPSFAEGFAGRGPPSPEATAGRARVRARRQMLPKYHLFGVFRISLAAGDDVLAR